MRTVSVVGIALAALTAAFSSPAQAVPVFIDLTIHYTNPPNTGTTLSGTAQFSQDINGVFIDWGDSVPIGTLSLGDTFSTVLYPPNPCNGSSCELGFSFDGTINEATGAITTYALENVPTSFPASLPIISIADFFPPNPCTGTCQANGLLVADDAPTQVGTWAVTIGQTPLPAALPLFATGLGALGLLGWRSRRQAQVA